MDQFLKSNQTGYPRISGLNVTTFTKRAHFTAARKLGRGGVHVIDVSYARLTISLQVTVFTKIEV